MHSFFGKLLRINLSTQSSTVETIEDSVFEQYLGGKGLGAYLLLREVKGDTDPLSAENKLIFTTGPASDTGHPAASRYGVFSKSPQTGIYAESYSGGHIAPVMKRTGFDAFIIEGVSPQPTFIHIEEAGAHFYDASAIWGMDSFDAEDKLKEVVGQKGTQALVIGPAGEKMVRFACIKNNRWRSAGRTGMGAVMGSKKVKGLVFTGEAHCGVAEEEKLAELIKSFRNEHKDTAGVKGYRALGTPMNVDVLNEMHSFPTRYWHEGRSKWVDSLSAEYMNNSMDVRPRACKGCFIACGKLTDVKKGPYAGLQIEGPEYETIYALGGLCCLENLEEVAYLNDLCDRLGVDTISAGNLAALAIEAGLQGKATDVPVYGDAEGIARLIEDIANRKGLGAILAGGIREAAAHFGMEDFAIHVKGMEPAGYDPRILKGMGLAYATSARGACHLRATFYKPELSGVIHPDQIEGKAELFIDYEDRLAIFDTLVFCRFYRDIVGWEQLQELIELFTGQSYSKEELRQMANRIITMNRRFNLACGITRADDTLPSRFFTEPIDNKVIKEADLERMVSEYYALRGWDEAGIPPDDEDEVN